MFEVAVVASATAGAPGNDKGPTYPITRKTVTAAIKALAIRIGAFLLEEVLN
jgi:hypothetical protein